MAGKLLCGLFALATGATAASISGSAGIDPSQVYIGGRLTFPQIPGINAPLFGWIGDILGFGGLPRLGSIPSFGNLPGSGRLDGSGNFPGVGSTPGNGGLTSFSGFGGNSRDSFSSSGGLFGLEGNNENGLTSYGSLPGLGGIPGFDGFPTFSGPPGVSSLPGFGGNDGENGKSDLSGIFGPFAPFLRQIPILNLFIHGTDGNSNSPFPDFTNLDKTLETLGGLNGSRTGNYSLPSFTLPDTSQGPFIPGLSEALEGARKNLKIALNISADISSGLRDAVAAALDSDHPADSIHIIMNTIASVYSTVAAHCPFLVVGSRVFHEGVRLAGEVARSIVNITAGTEGG
ncbi:collagen alpha-2(IV) chain-like [Copidosoma floridanum]|uniref:collagen alpha-2(IV) chain-like n=1 Tax=Copidosoma floridanum TaxID=29053 RepID=UPI0006C9E25D|nr:collagen alpha-2(IV) chain-like [Copidosoma floridanum]